MQLEYKKIDSAKVKQLKLTYWRSLCKRIKSTKHTLPNRLLKNTLYELS